jgi:enamine deaminase RidA (YjgF/YER057c/UK114 family)
MADGFNPRGIWQPNGRAFSQGVIQGPGEVVHVTGQVAWDERDQVVGIGDAEAQTEQCIRNVRTVLTEVGGVLDDIVSMTDLPAIQRVRSRYFAAGTAPASIVIQVAGLVVPELRVELVPIAVVPHDRFRRP